MKQNQQILQLFPRAVEGDQGAIVLHDKTIEHFTNLDKKLQHYFPSLTVSDKDWMRNPFQMQVDMFGK